MVKKGLPTQNFSPTLLFSIKFSISNIESEVRLWLLISSISLLSVSLTLSNATCEKLNDLQLLATYFHQKFLITRHYQLFHPKKMKTQQYSNFPNYCCYSHSQSCFYLNRRRRRLFLVTVMWWRQQQQQQRWIIIITIIINSEKRDYKCFDSVCARVQERDSNRYTWSSWRPFGRWFC